MRHCSNQLIIFAGIEALARPELTLPPELDATLLSSSCLRNADIDRSRWH
jgi:hypothetical protein